MTSAEIRNSFFKYFESKNHRIVPSAPVIPHGDPTLLFTNAGMNQFKDVFLGSGKRDYSRAADTQKCIRVSGKHNDLEEVGVDTYHHTFFEMLGNWSFGDYYKNEAIEWAWELLTEVWGLEKDRLYATVYRTDDEAFEIWKKYLPEYKILRFDEKDNFWEMGETGPCGPCSEIHFDKTPDKSGLNLVNQGSPDVIEIWNLVFIQYNRKQDGTLEPLSSKHVDTGMGFERVTAVIQNKDSNYDTDIFMPLINHISGLSGKSYKGGLDDKDSIAMRVIADHIRTLSFSIADGALPGNEGRGYVLRRILRRACRFARNLGFDKPILFQLVPVLVDLMGNAFSELTAQKETIIKVVKGEEESFLQTLDKGIERFENIARQLRQSGDIIFPGADAFLLYDTFGFPLDLTQLMARENGFQVDTELFNKLMEEQRDRSRKARKVIQLELELPDLDFKSEFTGYNETSTESDVLFIDDNKIILSRTPFYVESGGQVSDTGHIILGGEKYDVFDVRKSGDAIVHFCDRQLELLVGSKALAVVDIKRRRDIMRNHSATHLLHEALRIVLGNHVKQAGSLVAPEYLRFDFNHFDKVSSDEIKEIENIVNLKILDQIKVDTANLNLDEAAKNPKIKMFFGDKYGDIVRVITMDKNYSIELCGGTHVGNTSEIGLFKITSEQSIAAGVRRIEAVTGAGVYNLIDEIEHKLIQKSSEINDYHDKIKRLEKQLSSMKLNNIDEELEKMIKESVMVGEIRVISSEFQFENIDELRNAGELLRNKFGKLGAGLIVTVIDDKVQIVCCVTDDIKSKLPAGKLAGESAKLVGGAGGGKAHLATAGGKIIERIPDLLSEFPKIVENIMSN